MLFELLDLEEILSVTALSRDPTLSYHHRAAQKVAVNYGRTEEIIAADPDLVVTLEGTSFGAARMLERLGFRVLTVPAVYTLSEYRTTLTELARELGKESRAATIIAALEKSLPVLSDAKFAPRALIYRAGGFTPGIRSLEHDMLRLAGFKDVAEALRLEDGGFVALEEMLDAKPALLLVSKGHEFYTSRADLLLNHPAIKRAEMLNENTSPVLRRVRIEDRLWTCPGLHNAKAINRLIALRAQ